MLGIQPRSAFLHVCRTHQGFLRTWFPAPALPRFGARVRVAPQCPGPGRFAPTLDELTLPPWISPGPCRLTAGAELCTHVVSALSPCRLSSSGSGDVLLRATCARAIL